MLPTDHQDKGGQTVFYMYFVLDVTEQWEAGKEQKQTREKNGYKQARSFIFGTSPTTSDMC